MRKIYLILVICVLLTNACRRSRVITGPDVYPKIGYISQVEHGSFPAGSKLPLDLIIEDKNNIEKISVEIIKYDSTGGNIYTNTKEVNALNYRFSDTAILPSINKGSQPCLFIVTVYHDSLHTVPFAAHFTIVK